MFLKVHMSQLFKGLVFSEVCNHSSIICDVIRKWLLEDVLPSEICILNENEQASSGLRNCIKKGNNIFLFYNNYIDDCSIKLVILNKKMIMSVINKNDQIIKFKLYKLTISNLIYR